MIDVKRAVSRLGAVLVIAVVPAVGAEEALAPFPAPAPGQARYAITLEALPDEASRRVELLVGRSLEVDCNRQQFLGTLSREVVQGWGYSYHVVRDVRGPAGTLMACPGESRRRAFVSLGGGPHWVRYNSRLPVVVYVPEGFEVRYRLWSAAHAVEPAERR
jgi:ecotin